MTSREKNYWGAVVWLLVSGVVLSILFYQAFASRYTLERHGHRVYQSLATLEYFSNDGAYWFVGGMLAVFACYGVGYFKGVRLASHFNRRQKQVALGIVIVGGVVFNFIFVRMYPADAIDIYDYIMRGRMSAVYGLNPFKDFPSQVPEDEFYAFTAWQNIRTAYGPAWEILASGVSRLTATAERNTQVLAYKLLVMVGYALTAGFIGLTLWQIAPQRAILGVYLFAWNPLVLYSTAGSGHNDAVMLAALAFSFFALSRRWYVVATLGAILGTLVKFIPALMLPLIALVAFRDLGFQRWLRYAVLSAVLGGLLVLVFYAPYWQGLETLQTERRTTLFTGSVATVARQWLGYYLDGAPSIHASPLNTPNTNYFLANVTALFFFAFYFFQWLGLWKKWDTLSVVRVMARVLLAYLLVSSMWFHQWYVLWVVAMIAMLEDTPVRRLGLVFSYLVTWQLFLYDYLSIQTVGKENLPWLDLVPVAVYMGTTWTWIAVYQGLAWWRSQHMVADDRLVGQRLQHLRDGLGLSLSQLSDEVLLAYDLLGDYETGKRPVRLDHARTLAHRYNVPLGDILP